jgi:cytochrome oxidase Cu insertion factor (SCO1/SenC/PrrC family)
MNSMAHEGVSPSGAPQISHSGYFLLVDQKAHIRGAYDSNDIHKLDEMIRDARYLVRTGR